MYPYRDPNLPITEELPVVRPRSPGYGIGLALIGLLVAGGVIIGAAVLISQREEANISTEVVPLPSVDVPTVDPAVTKPTIVELADEAVSAWQVAGAESGLNVRAGPGTTNAVMTTLAPGSVVAGTGERVTVNGSEWKELDLPDGGRGWASASFLVPTDLVPGASVDDAGDPDGPTGSAPESVGCFRGTDGTTVRALRIEFRRDGEISGPAVAVTDAGLVLQTVDGTLSAGQAVVTVTDVDTGRATSERWTFRPADVVLGDGTVVAIVDCATVTELFPPS